MATIKSFTDLEQSEKLAEILPIESADMCYLSEESLFPKVNYNGMVFFNSEEERPTNIIYCWSLAALLDILNKTAYFIDEDASVDLSSYKTIEWDLGIVNSGLESVTESNPVDACVAMVEQLHELNLL